MNVIPNNTSSKNNNSTIISVDTDIILLAMHLFLIEKNIRFEVL